jgi:hypothetical protein
MKREWNKKLIEWGLKLKKQRIMKYITCQKGEKKNIQTTIGNNPTIVSCHTPF